jgi:hypothetical protein
VIKAKLCATNELSCASPTSLQTTNQFVLDDTYGARSSDFL